MAGFGIATYNLGTATTIIENAFEGNLAAAIFLDQGEFTAITKNTSKNDGSFVVCYGDGINFITQNQGRNFGAHGFLPLPHTSPPIHADAAIDIAASVADEIDDNDLEGGKASNYNGIAFSAIFVTSPPAPPGPALGPDAFCHVNNNTIKGFAGNGIVAEALSGSGTLAESQIEGNDLEDNGNDGILIEAATTFGNFSNTMLHNEAEGNHTFDCEDDTNGSTHVPPVSGTLGTANTWANNIGTLSSPRGLCAPGTWHDHD
jgi:hypothetical protein